MCARAIITTFNCGTCKSQNHFHTHEVTSISTLAPVAESPDPSPPPPLRQKRLAHTEQNIPFHREQRSIARDLGCKGAFSERHTGYVFRRHRVLSLERQGHVRTPVSQHQKGRSTISPQVFDECFSVVLDNNGFLSAPTPLITCQYPSPAHCVPPPTPVVVVTRGPETGSRGSVAPFDLRLLGAESGSPCPRLASVPRRSIQTSLTSLVSFLPASASQLIKCRSVFFSPRAITTALCVLPDAVLFSLSLVRTTLWMRNTKTWIFLGTFQLF